jgi:hypothetical protein
MPNETAPDSGIPDPPAHQRGADGADLVLAALDHLRGISSAGGTALGPPPLARQEAGLREWADRLGLLLNPAAINSKLTRGGQEHDIYDEGDRVIKVTRNGVFGFSPGIELALVASSQDARRFHLWDATPLEYLERLHLQNFLVPGTTAEIDAWFASFGFGKITDSAYYRPEDNLGIFAAHDKNVVRAGDILMPFDVIPCHPAGGFLAFIEATLAAGHSLRAVRTVTTHQS